MRTAKQLLELLTIAFPPFPGAKHAIVFHENKLMIVLAFGPADWKHFVIEETDLDRPANELLEDISGVLAAIAFDQKNA